jgi:hypothetical protein
MEEADVAERVGERGDVSEFAWRERTRRLVGSAACHKRQSHRQEWSGEPVPQARDLT